MIPESKVVFKLHRYRDTSLGRRVAVPLRVGHDHLDLARAHGPGVEFVLHASHPGGHGIFQFFDTQERGYGARITESTDLGRSSVWDWMAEQGWTLGLVNIPMSTRPGRCRATR